MKPGACLVAATAAMVFAAPAHTQVDCANFYTRAFFKAAKASDVTRCLEEGADPNVQDESGNTSLHFAAASGNSEAVTALTEAGTNPNARNVICMTPLHSAAALWRTEAGLALLEAGANPAARDGDGNLPFDKIPAGVGDVLLLQSGGEVFPSRGNRPGKDIGGSLQAEFYGTLNQAKLDQAHRLLSPNPIPPRVH